MQQPTPPQNSFSLQGKVAMITGASSGIGYASALLFAAAGAKLVLAARRAHELQQLVQRITAQGGQAIALAGDVADETYACALTELACGKFGKLDIAFNNAGTLGTLAPLPQLTLSDWQHCLHSNLTSAFLLAKYQLPAMQANGGGSLIFTSSFVGYTAGMAGMAAYAASKAGLIGLTQALAAEVAAQGIRVNALLPGGTDTPMGQSVTQDPASLALVQQMHALKRLAQPEEIARSALYLASDASSFTTGSALLADGGISVYRG